MNIDFKKWCKSAIIRAIKTFCQTFVATIGTTSLLSEVHWKLVFSSSFLAFILSIVTSMAGLPEVEKEAEINMLTNYIEGGDKNGQ